MSSTLVGLVDIVGRRANITETAGPARIELMRDIAVKLRDTAPWLLTDEELEDFKWGDAAYWQYVLIGGQRYDSHPYHHEWYRREGDRRARFRRRDDPIWAIDALQHADEASAAGAGQVREVDCDRFGFHVDLERHRGELDVPPRIGPLGAPHLIGEVWIDERSRIRRVTWIEVPRTRSRFKPGGEVGVEMRPQTTIELWDFDTPTDIDAPEIRRSKPPLGQLAKVLVHAAREIRLRKRQYDTGPQAHEPA